MRNWKRLFMRRKGNPVRHLIVSYLLVMFLAIGLLTVPLQQSFVQNKNYITHLHEKSLDTAAGLIDEYLSVQKKQLFSLSGVDAKVSIAAAGKTLAAKDYFEVYLTMQMMKERGLDPNVFLFYKSSNMVIGANAACTLEQFYENSFSGAKLRQKELKSLLFSEKNSVSLVTMIENADGSKKIMLRHPIQYQNGDLAVVAVSFFDVADLFAMASLSNNIESGNMLLEDAEHRVIEMKFKDMIYGMHNAVEIRRASDILPLHYVFYLPYSVIYRSVWVSLKLFLIVIAIGLLGLVALTLHQLFRNKKSLSHIIDQSNERQKQLEQQKPMLRNGFFSNLLYGKFETLTQAEIAAHLAGVVTDFSFYAVLVVDIQSEQPLDTKQIEEIRLTAYALDQRLGNRFCIQQTCHLQYDSISIVCAANDKPHLTQEIANLLEQIKQHFANPANKVVSLGVGDVQQELGKCAESYRQARCAIYNIFTHSVVSVKFYAEIQPILSGYTLTDQTKNLLVHAVSQSHLEQVDEIIRKIVKENFIDSNLTESTMQMLLFELCGLINDLKYLIDETDNAFLDEVECFVLHFYQRENLYKINDIRQMLLKITRYVAERQKLYGEKLMLEIRSYIDEHYCECELSLCLVSGLFELSESYFSQLFKKYLQVNFSQYLEEKRLDKARYLLETTYSNMQSIVEMVGYQSVNTFGRAFKRRYDISPGEYRKVAQLQGEIG